MTVIGGTVLTGGKGTIIGTVIGVLLLRIMRNGIVHGRACRDWPTTSSSAASSWA